MTINHDTEVTIRARAFSGEGIRTHRCRVDADSVLPMTGAVVHGLIRVWDSVAGHYTTCHSLSDSAKRRARAEAEKAQ